MTALAGLRALDRNQRAIFVASLLGWTLDAFDFFLLVFLVRTIAAEFHAPVAQVSYAIALTLFFRPLGAFVFGLLADRFGRRPVLMADIILFSVLELATACSHSLTSLLVLRALFGFAMGGEWGIGSSLAMESLPAASRGIVSGILQEGYAFGYLLAAVAFGLLFPLVGWRGLFVVGALPALLVLYIRRNVPESPAWQAAHAGKRKSPPLLPMLKAHWPLFLYAVGLMTAFNLFSHGTQDLYPTFLQAQHGLPSGTVSAILVAANFGAITGGIFFGAWSQRVGRKRAIVTAALLALPVIPLWAFAPTPLLLGLGAFLLQIAVQGAWGVVPAHLNELSPAAIRGTFPGVSYQLGNLLASFNAVWQAGIAERHGGNYGLALALVAAGAAVILAAVTAWGPEAQGRVLDGKEA